MGFKWAMNLTFCSYPDVFIFAAPPPNCLFNIVLEVFSFWGHSYSWGSHSLIQQKAPGYVRVKPVPSPVNLPCFKSHSLLGYRGFQLLLFNPCCPHASHPQNRPRPFSAGNVLAWHPSSALHSNSSRLKRGLVRRLLNTYYTHCVVLGIFRHLIWHHF